MKGLFIPEITEETFRNGCLESIEALMAEGEIYDIEHSPWVPVSERLPENANHLGALCPRYRISSAKYGVTEGWYNPDTRTWYGLVWQLTPGNIEMKRGDIPAVMRMIDVTAWMELPAPYKAESENEA